LDETLVADRSIQIGSTPLDAPLGVAPMPGMTAAAFRRLVKR